MDADKAVASYALFARYNPQPLFRIDENGTITAGNPATEALFGVDNIYGLNITEVLPNFSNIDFRKIIEDGLEEDTIIILGKKHYRMLLKGVIENKSVHIYSNDITEITEANQIIKSQAKGINDSIKYGSLIQKAILPSENILKTNFEHCFVFFKPRDVVSGDFYWFHKSDDTFIMVAADCTGQGVPGAFMSMLNVSLLNEVIKREQIYHPATILNQVRKRLIESLAKNEDKYELRDGMELPFYE